MKTALITGITGQDGSYLAELLLSKGYVVHGIVRRSSSFNTGRLEHIFKRLHLHFGDVTDGTSLRRVLTRAQPAEVYNLAAQSHVAVSFEEPELTHEIVAMGALRLFEAVRDVVPAARVYQASSSEMFGGGVDLDENSPFRPRSPYAVAKVAAHWHAVNMREAYGMYISCGILFNHESPRRGETFVTKKIVRAAAERRTVVLGNLSPRRDWGHAEDYVRAMWLLLQQDKPDDAVVATGVDRSVRDFIRAVECVTDRHLDVETHERYMRPNEVEVLRGNPSYINGLGWEPKWTFEDMVRDMVNSCAR